MKLSAIIIAKNAGTTIRRTLASLSFADEIIVVDSGSSDNTVAIAERHRARVIHQSWLGYGPQKNAGAGESTGDFLLFIDADEEVPPALAEEIQRVIKNYPLRSTPYSLYWLRIVTVFLGRPLTHLYGHNPRFFHKSFARWTDAAVHEQVIRQKNGLQPTTYNLQPVKLGDADTDLFTTPLLHHSHPTIRSYLEKMHRYTTLDAKEMRSTGKHRSGKKVQPFWWLPGYLAGKQFIKMYGYRRGFLDGYAGIIWCALSAYYEWEMARKYLKLCA